MALIHQRALLAQVPSSTALYSFELPGGQGGLYSKDYWISRRLRAFIHERTAP